MKRIVLWVLATLGFLVLFLAMSVGLLRVGDPVPQRPVVLHNATRVPVNVRAQNGQVEWSLGQLAPGQNMERPWPTEIERSVKALDEQGEMVFCRTYDGRQLEMSNWTIEIVEGDIRCSTGSN